jgi:hypothetical protein
MGKYKTAPSGRRLATALMTAGEFHRPYLAPPNLHPEHVKILREAFLKTAKDPTFLEETKKKKLDLDPSSGEEVETPVKEVMSQPGRYGRTTKEVNGALEAVGSPPFWSCMMCARPQLLTSALAVALKAATALSTSYSFACAFAFFSSGALILSRFFAA